MSDHPTDDRQLVERSDERKVKANGNSTASQVMTPIILSLGKKKKKQLKRLKKGKGRMMDEVLDVIEQVQANLGDQAADKILVPVVIIYRRKEPRFRGLF
jgi:hypothetical protein